MESSKLWFVTYSIAEDKLDCVAGSDYVYEALLAIDYQRPPDYFVIDYFVHRGKAMDFMETMRKHLDYKKTIASPPESDAQ